MNCTIKARNGKISILADTLNVVFGEDIASYIYDKTRSSAFRSKMAGSKFVDKNGEAIPLFYVDKHKLNNKSLAEEIATTKDNINYLTTDYTAALRNELDKPDVVFLTSLETTKLTGTVIPNLSYISNSAKNAFGYKNTININNGQEVIVFDEEEIIKMSEIADEEVNEYEEQLLSEITPAMASDTVNELTKDSMNELLKQGITNTGSAFIVGHDINQTEEVIINKHGSRVEMVFNLSKHNNKIFSTKPDLLSPVLRNIKSKGFSIIKKAITQSEYFKEIHDNNSGFSVFKLQDEIISSIVTAKFYIEFNKDSDTANKLQAELDKFGDNASIDLGYNEIMESLYILLTPSTNEEVDMYRDMNDTNTMLIDNLLNTFSNKDNLLLLSKQLSTNEKEIKDNVIIRWQARLVKMLDKKLDNIKMLKTRFGNISEFDNTDKDNTKAINENIKTLNRSLEELHNTENDYKLLKAITANTIVDYNNLKLVERYFNELNNIDVDKLDYVGKMDYAFKVNTIREILETISDITNFTDIKESILSNTASYNVDEITRIKKHISELGELMDKAQRYKDKNKELSEMAMQLVLDDIESPDGRIVIKDSLYGISDLTTAQTYLDSLMDVHNPLAAMLKKNYQKYLFMKDKEVARLQDRAYDDLHNILGSMYDNKEAVKEFMNSILDKNNNLIQEYDTSIDDIRDKKLHELSVVIRNTYNGSIAHKKALFEFNDWFRKHYQTKFTDKYYEIMNSLPIDVRMQLDELSARKKEVVDAVKARNNGVFDTDLLEENEKLQLDSVVADRRALIKNNKDVAKFYEDISDMTIIDNNKELKDIFSKIKKTKNLNNQKAWLLRNADLNDTFQEELQEVFDKIPSNKYNKFVRKLVNNITNKVKDRDGLIDVSKLSINEQEDLQLLYRFMQATNKQNLVMKDDDTNTPLSEYGTFRWNIETVRSFMNGPVEPSYTRDVDNNFTSDSKETQEYFKNIERAFEWLDTNIENVPTDYYIATRNKLESDKSIEGIAKYKEWYANNHIDGKPLEMWTKIMPKDVTNNLDKLKGKSHIAGTITYKPEYINENYETDERGFGLPKERKINPKYQSLTQQQKDMIQYLNRTMTPLLNHLTNTIYRKGSIPSIENNDSLSRKEKDKVTHTILKDTANEDLRFIRFNELYLLNQKPIIRYRILNRNDNETEEHYYKTITKSIRDSYGYDLTKYVNNPRLAENDDSEIISTAAKNTYSKYGSNYTLMDLIDSINDIIKEENKKNHRESLDMDITKTLPQFINDALTHKYKTRLESQLRLGLSLIKDATVNKTTMLGGNKVYNSANKVFNKITGKKEATENVTEKTNNRLYERMKLDLEMIFYDNFTQPGDNNKYIEMARNYVSLTGIGFNPYSAIKNVTYGGLMMFTEAHAGYHFTKADLRAGSAEYLRAFNELITDVTNSKEGKPVKAKSLATAMMSYFDVLDTQTETNLLEDEDDKNKRKIKSVKNLTLLAAYGMQQVGESFMQHSVLLGMTRSHRVINGKIMSFEEYAMNKIKGYSVKDIRNDLSKAKELMAEKKETISKLKEKFEQYSTLHDVSKLENGSYKAEGVDEWELAEFKIKVQGVNQKIHGIYNKSDKGTIEHTILGQLMMQFRHWMRPGWVKRYGSRGGWKTEKYWNVRRKEYDIGSWKVVRDFLKMPLSENGLDYYLDGNERNARTKLIAVAKAYTEFLRNIKVYYNVLSTQEQAEVRRVISEMGALVTAAALSLMLVKLGGDDDEEESNMYNSLVYLSKATTIELAGFVPVYSWIGQLQQLILNPVAILSQGGKIAKLLYDILAYPLRTPDERIYQGGVYYKDDKVLIGASKLTPFVNSIVRYTHMTRNQSTYKSQYLGF